MPKYAKGQSGNPKGRPPSHRKVGQLRALIGQYAEPMVKRLIKLAVEESDTSAAKLLIERCIPAVKPVEGYFCPTPRKGGLEKLGDRCGLSDDRQLG